MNEVMTVQEMEQRFPREWVLIGDPTLNAEQRVTAGTVLFHSKDRDETDRMALQLRPHDCAIFYMGPMLEEGVAFAL